jgi:hypothetical protein
VTLKSCSCDRVSYGEETGCEETGCEETGCEQTYMSATAVDFSNASGLPSWLSPEGTRSRYLDVRHRNVTQCVAPQHKIYGTRLAIGWSLTGSKARPGRANALPQRTPTIHRWCTGLQPRRCFYPILFLNRQEREKGRFCAFTFRERTALARLRGALNSGRLSRTRGVGGEKRK